MKKVINLPQELDYIVFEIGEKIIVYINSLFIKKIEIQSPQSNVSLLNQDVSKNVTK